MNRNDIDALVRFNFWANDRLLEACEKLPPESLIQPVSPDPGWGSLRGVLVHILDTEFGWRAALQLQDADIILKEEDFADVAALRARWKIEKTAWMDYIEELTEDLMDQGYGEDPDSGINVWQTIVHVVMHGIQHRGEAAMLLTGYGSSPGELDFDAFLMEAKRD